MPAELVAPVDVMLSWTRARGGTTAVLRRPDPAGPWVELGRTDGTEYLVRGLHPHRSHVFAAAETLADGGLAPEEDWQVLRVAPMASDARPERPEAPSGLYATQEGALLHVTWDRASEERTHTYELRQGTTWEDGRLIARDLPGPPYSFPWWASGTTKLWLAAVDRHGRPSLAKASVSLVVAALDTHVTTATTAEAGSGWTGTKDGVEVDGTDLVLTELTRPFGAWTSPFGSYAAIPFCARRMPSGSYTTATVNAGQVETQRVEVDIDTAQPLASMPFGAMRMSVFGRRALRDGTPTTWGIRSWCARQSWRGDALMPCDVLVEIDTSQTNAGSWDGWRAYVPGSYTFWRMRLRVTLTGDGFRALKLPRLTVRRRKFNFKDEGSAVLPGGAAYAITFAAPFSGAPYVTATIYGASAVVGPRIEVKNVTKTGCTLEVFDTAGGVDTSVAAVLHWHALGT